MKWNTTATKPPFDKPIIVVHNVYIAGKTEFRTTTGILKCAGDLKWAILRGGYYCYISIGDIHGWCLESSCANDAFHTIYKKPVEVICPVCGRKVTVTAQACNTYYACAPVVIDTLRNRVLLDLDESDMTCDFEYICDCCGESVAPNLLALHKMIKKQRNPVKDFTDDADKMLDFFLLSKEQFLETYSYITEKEWDKTLERVNKEWMPNGKKGN